MILEDTIDAVRGSFLTPAERLTLIALASHADHITGENAWPSARTLADITGQGRRTIAAALKQLEAERWIERTGTQMRGVVVWRVTTERALTFDGNPDDVCTTRTQEAAQPADPDVCTTGTQATGARLDPDWCPTGAQGPHNQDHDHDQTATALSEIPSSHSHVCVSDGQGVAQEEDAPATWEEIDRLKATREVAA